MAAAQARDHARAAAGAVLVALAFTGCGGASRRDQVSQYIQAVDAVQRRTAPAMQAVDAAYLHFSQGHLGLSATAVVAGSAQIVADARAKVAAIAAPAVAQTMRLRLLALYDEDVALARESTALARYLPAATAALRPLAGLDRDLRGGLRRATASPAQAAVLLRYRSGLAAVIARLRALRPPPVLISSHRRRIGRLDAIATLSSALAQALARKDAQATASLLLRFRTLYASVPASGPDRAALAAYLGRLRRVDTATAAVRREQQRLERTLG